MLDLTVVSPKRILFDDAVTHVFMDGDDSEYEILSFHAHLVGVLREGKIIIDNKKSIPIKKGIVRFYENRCSILVEELDAAVISNVS